MAASEAPPPMSDDARRDTRHAAAGTADGAAPGTAGAAAAPDEDNAIVAERRAKLARLREQGPAYPNDFRPADRTAHLAAAHGAKTREELEASPVEVSVGGRMVLKRV